MRDTRRLIPYGIAIADRNGIVGIEIHNVTVFDIYRRHTVTGGRNVERVFKAHLAWSGLDLSIPIERLCRTTEPQMPLTNQSGGVSFITQKTGDGWFLWIDNQRSVSRKDARAFVAKRILPG